jgi:hypothetical protein
MAIVTLPPAYFAQSAAKILPATTTTTTTTTTRICIFPYVVAQERDAWQNYTTASHAAHQLQKEWRIRGGASSLTTPHQEQGGDDADVDNSDNNDYYSDDDDESNNNNNNDWNVIFNNQEYEKTHPGVHGTESPGEWCP